MKTSFSPTHQLCHDVADAGLFTNPLLPLLSGSFDIVFLPWILFTFYFTFHYTSLLALMHSSSSSSSIGPFSVNPSPFTQHGSQSLLSEKNLAFPLQSSFLIAMGKVFLKRGLSSLNDGALVPSPPHVLEVGQGLQFSPSLSFPLSNSDCPAN